MQSHTTALTGEHDIHLAGTVTTPSEWCREQRDNWWAKLVNIGERERVNVNSSGSRVEMRGEEGSEGEVRGHMEAQWDSEAAGAPWTTHSGISLSGAQQAGHSSLGTAQQT